MKLKSKTISFLLSVAASVFLVIIGCGGGGGGGGDFVPILPTSADVSLTKTVDNPSPNVDETVVFAITISNAGPAVATGVIVTDKLPSGFTYVSDTSGGSYNPATGVWSVGSLSVGGILTLSITATVNETGIYINLAEVSATNDTTPSNNNDGISAPPPSLNVSLNQIQTDCNTNQVKAFATVVDQNGNSVITLAKDDFTVTENQTELSPNDFDVEFVDRSAIPISFAIVLDYSQSIFDSGEITQMQNAAIALIDELLDSDRATIIKFNATVQVVQPFTNDKAALKAAVQAPFAPQAVTELYKAILRGVDDTAAEPAGNRKAVVYFTDGRNNPDLTAPFVPMVDDVVAAANADSIPIFGIVLGTDFRQDDIEELTFLSQATGGIFYPSFQPGDLEEIYQQLADTLLINQYVFTYISGLTGGQPANLTIEALDANGLSDSDTKQFVACP
jgi:VWFA-related protein